MEKVTVSAAALRQVLNALNGPGHYIRELQVTRGPLIGDDNPINILCDEYNAAVEAYNKAKEVDPCDKCNSPELCKANGRACEA